MGIGRTPAGRHIRYFPRRKTACDGPIPVAGKQRLEHRVVIEEHLGRPLLRSEVANHIDGNCLTPRREKGFCVVL